MVVGDIVRGVIEGIAGVVRERGRTSAPQVVSPPTSINYYMLNGGTTATSEFTLPWSTAPGEVAIPSTLHVEFVSSDEDVGWFTTDQPAMVLVFALDSDDEATLGVRLGEVFAIDVVPGAYGVLAVAYVDDDLDIVDGIGFTAVGVDDWGYDVYSAVELHEVNEEQAEDFMDELDQALSGVFA